MNWWLEYGLPDPRGLLEIAVLAVVIYYSLLFLRGTRGAQVLYGLVLVLGALIALTSLFHLDILTWLFQRFSVYLAIALLIIFQPEIRRVLAQLGRQPLVAGDFDPGQVDTLVRAAVSLAEGKIGALIAVEREASLRSVEEGGTPVDAVLTPELLTCIFYPHTPLHDGGVVVRGTRVAAAACFFPLSQHEDIGRTLGSRHRAAIGLSEETDALIIVVSEETGALSVAYHGKLRRGLDERHLRRILHAVLGGRGQPESRRTYWLRWARRLRGAVTRSRPEDREAHHHAA